MKLTVIRIDQKNQKHITYKTVEKLAEMISQQRRDEKVENLRRLIRATADNPQPPFQHELPHIFPVVEMQRNQENGPTVKAMNGLVMLTSRHLSSAREVDLLKQRAMALPSTVAALRGASDLTVKVLVSVSRRDGELPTDEETMANFHREAYRQVFDPYNALMDNVLERRKATLTDCFCMTYDAAPLLNPKAVPFIVDERLPKVLADSPTKSSGSQHDGDTEQSFEPDADVMAETHAMVDRLQRRYSFRYNTVMGYTEYRLHGEYTDFQPVDQSVIFSMALWLRMQGVNVRDNDVRRFLMSNLIQRYDPVDEYLWEASGKWDGRDHIGRLARTVKTTNPKWEEWFRRWFVGMVAQWRGGGFRRYGNAYVPLLVSRQGYNKTTFCKSLIPEELQWGYNDTLSLQEKRPVLQAMSQFLLINLDEFNSIPAKVQQGFLKNVISLSSVKVKRPYGRHVEDLPRLASFIATANMTDLLADPSGSRRFLSVELTGPIDVSQRPDHQQLYAQAQALLDQKFRYWFDKKEEQEIMANNRQFQLHTPAEDLLMEYYELPANEDEGQYLSPTAIFSRLKQLAGSSLRVNSITVLGRMLANIEGIQRKRTNHGTEYLLKERE